MKKGVIVELASTCYLLIFIQIIIISIRSRIQSDCKLAIERIYYKLLLSFFNNLSIVKKRVRKMFLEYYNESYTKSDTNIKANFVPKI